MSDMIDSLTIAMPQIPQDQLGQAGKPHGFVGRVFGWIMARTNHDMNVCAVEALRAEPADRVLEIGFGPGDALALLAERMPEGFVAGIDHSGNMVRDARKRNAQSIAAGRMDVRQGSVEALPFPEASFAKALAVNNHQFWPDPAANLREIARVLKPGGVLLLAIRVKDPEQPRRFDNIAYTSADMAQLYTDLAAAGFTHDAPAVQAAGHMTAACIRAVKGA